MPCCSFRFNIQAKLPYTDDLLFLRGTKAFITMISKHCKRWKKCCEHYFESLVFLFLPPHFSPLHFFKYFFFTYRHLHLWFLQHSLSRHTGLTTKKDPQFRYSAWGMQGIMWLLSIIKMKRRQINEEGILLQDERGYISFSYKTL